MYIYTSNSDIIAELRKDFLFLNREGTIPLDLSQFKGKLVVYAIENKNNGKIYIGKTTSLLNRSNNYIWSYRFPNKTKDTRSIILAICREGISNFKMYPIDVASTREELVHMEAKYIYLYDTMNPLKGYNDQIGSLTDRNKAGKGGHPHTIESKMTRSKLVACINPETKDVTISIGMKLFADYMNTTKDIIKNAARKPCRYKGYYIIYLNETDRRTIECDYLSKQDAYIENLHSRGMYNIANMRDNYDEYRYIVNLVNNFIADREIDIFTDAGFDCRFLTYNADPNISTTYVFEDIVEFLNLLEDID